MAIVITIDKRSELEWVQTVLGTGVINISSREAEKLKELGVDLKQNVTYKPSDIYEEDITDQIKKHNEKNKEKIILIV